MEIWTYLIKSLIKRTYYTGISENPNKRLKEHNSGKVKITAKNRPYVLVYKKSHKDYKDARRHEKWLKKKNIAYKDKLANAAQLAPPGMGGVK